MKIFFSFIVIMLMITTSITGLARPEAMLLEKIKLQHKPAGDIIPLVEPFLPENAVINGEGYNIILKTTAENMPQVKELIADLDTPLQQLQISVSLDPAVLQQTTGKSAPSSEVPDNNKSDTSSISQADTTQIYKTKGHEVAAGTQVIQVLQDRWSMIRTGQSIPVMKRVRNPDGTVTESISYQQVNQGLRIRPQLTGEQVMLSIQPFYEAASQSGTGQQLYYKQEKQTKTRLGNWIRIDTTTGSLIQSESSKTQQNPTATTSTSSIYLKVDLAP